jgi:hypothetical protein
MNNELDRRFLLGGLAGAAGISAIAAIARGGPLNPPAGAIAPTGRTLSEIYDKIPAPGSAGGRIPIPGGNTPVTITQPGAYVLTGNLTNTGSNAIYIAGSNIDIDLNGYTVAGSADLTAVVAQGRSIRVRNGLIRESYYGVNLSDAVSVVLEDLLIDRCRFAGVAANGGTLLAITVRKCTITDTGAISPPSDPPNGAYRGIYLNGSSHAVVECVVQRITPPTGSAFRGIEVIGSGNVVARSAVTNHVPLAGVGIALSGGSVYRDNTSVNFSIPYNGGVNGGGNA